MFSREYRFKFYLNARHTTSLNEKVPKIHPHTWEIAIFLRREDGGIVQFTSIETDIGNYLSRYENTLLNEIPPFDRAVPTMENIGEVFCAHLFQLLKDKGWILYRLEISENPTRTYIIRADEGICDRVENISGDFVFEDGAGAGSGTDEAAACDQEAEPPADGGNNADAGNNSGDGGSNSGDNGSNSGDDASNSNNADAGSRETDSGREKDTESLADKEKARKETARYLIISGCVILVSAILLLFLITRSGPYPWGSDAWGHLFKSRMLYDEVREGNLFPLYSDSWYNGTQPFRYWAPLPYYLLLTFEFISGGNAALTYNIFLAFVIIAGAAGWVLWGLKTGRRAMGLLFGILWFFMPDNLRVLFSEGNIPRVVVTVLFPYLLLAAWDYVESRSRKSLIFLFILSFMLTLCHAMISAMAAITVFIFTIWYGAGTGQTRRSYEAVGALAAGILFSGIWLFPALKGGIISLNPEAVLEAAKQNALSITQSLNPFYRLAGNKEVFYFGLSIALISLFGLVFGGKRSRAGFAITLLVLAGTTEALFSLIAKLPMSQLFWMWRFAPLAMATFLYGLLLWQDVKKPVLGVIVALLVLDGAFTFRLLAYGAGVPDVKADLDSAVAVSSNRIAVLDLSRFGSFPSYYLGYNDAGKRAGQVFGWASQGARTMPNLVWLNTALEKGWYPFLFDRSLELGADTLIVMREEIKKEDAFINEALRSGYEIKESNSRSIILKYPVDGPFATTAGYEALGIGRYANNISFVFPCFEVGGSTYLDDYSDEKLMKYKVIYLSGFKYRDKVKAEDMVKRLSQKGLKFVIDMTGAETDIFTSRASFLGVIAQPVEFIGNYPALQVRNSEIRLGSMPEDNIEWRTVYLENLDRVYGSADFQNQGMSFWGMKLNENVAFIGFNLPYFAVETGDEKAIGLLEEVTGLKAYEPPKREIVGIQVEAEKDIIRIKADKEGAITGLAALDSFVSTGGAYDELHNLVLMEVSELELKIIYPYFWQSLALSLAGIVVFLALYGAIFRREGKTGQNAGGRFFSETATYGG